MNTIHRNICINIFVIISLKLSNYETVKKLPLELQVSKRSKFNMHLLWIFWICFLPLIASSSFFASSEYSDSSILSRQNTWNISLPYFVLVNGNANQQEIIWHQLITIFAEEDILFQNVENVGMDKSLWYFAAEERGKHCLLQPLPEGIPFKGIK